MSESWRHLYVEGLGPISRIVAVFQIGPPLARLPIASFKVKVIERFDGSFVGTTNVARRTPDGSPDWIRGFGTSVDTCLEDTLRYFIKTIIEIPISSEADLEWAASEGF